MDLTIMSIALFYQSGIWEREFPVPGLIERGSSPGLSIKTPDVSPAYFHLTPRTHILYYRYTWLGREGLW